MDNLQQESRQDAISRLRILWGNSPGVYWDELRKAKLMTLEVFPELDLNTESSGQGFGKAESEKKFKR